MEHTLKTLRILFRSNFQEAIVSLSFFAWKRRDTVFRLLCLMAILWILATVLQLRTVWWVVRNVCGWSNSRCQLIYCITHRLVEIAQFLSIHPPVKRSTNVSALQPEFNILQLVSHLVLGVRELGADQRRRGNEP